jgi:plastocyanin
MRKSLLVGVLFLALTLILSACSGTSTTSTPTPATTSTPTPIATPTPTATPITGQASVNISGFAFVPSTLTVSVGTTVTWTNNDSVSHTVTSNDDLFDSGNLAKGATFSHTFEQKGTFNYQCTIHPFMTGEIIVE